jgi:myo-inositol-1(or 4)-monophosphatase
MQREINVSLILEAIKQAGDSFLKDFKKTAIPQDRESLLVQFNAIEEKCLALLKASLAADFPETPWSGEEFDYREQQQPLDLPEYWLCDSMDGAIQYMQHLPGWTINLVLVRNGRPHFAAIYDPLAQEMFWAIEGAGAYLNDAPIKPSGKTDLSIMLAVFEYALPYTKVPGLNQKIGAAVGDLLDHFGVVRNYGPHGLQLAYIGAGRIDAFYQQGLDTYNWLGGILIAKEAGAEILTTDARPWTWGEDSLMVAAPGIAGKFLQAKAVNLAS